jgi:guanylate kinase
MPRTLLIIAGPSCAGKSPLLKALKRLHGDLLKGFRSPVLYHTRKARPGETDGVDYHFRSRKEVKTLRGDDRFEVFKVRADLQAVDIAEFRSLVAEGNVVYEGNVDVALALKGIGDKAGARVIDVFLSPLSGAEVRRLGGGGSFGQALVEMMRRRLLRRAYSKAAHLSLPDLEDIEARAAPILSELAQAHRFSHVIPCHDGEDSDHWSLFAEPVGDAGRAATAVASVLRGAPDGWVERWPKGLVEV